MIGSALPLSSAGVTGLPAGLVATHNGNGSVAISGTVSLNGGDNVITPNLAEPGPGGFRGEGGYFVPGVIYGAGFGPGRGGQGNRYGGSYGTQGSGGPVT